MTKCFCNTNDAIVYDSHAGVDVCTTCGVVVEMVFDDSEQYQRDDPYYHPVVTRSNLQNKLIMSLKSPIEKMEMEYENTIEFVARAINISTDHVACTTAKSIAKSCYVAGNTHHKKNAFIIACMYIACKYHDIPRELRQFSVLCAVDIRIIHKELSIVGMSPVALSLKSTTSNTNSIFKGLAIRFIQGLNIDDESGKKIKRSVLEIFESYPCLMDLGKKPRSIVSGIIAYLLQKHSIHVPLHTVSTISGVCNQTIISNLKLVNNYINNQGIQCIQSHSSGAVTRRE